MSSPNKPARLFETDIQFNDLPAAPAKQPALEIHPLALMFPRMNADEYVALLTSIKENGQRVPLTIHEGKVLDEGNRLKALQKFGMEPITVSYVGLDPAGYLIDRLE